MKYSYINEMDIYNGPGVRVTLSLQGCEDMVVNHSDVSLKDFNNGKEFDKNVEDEIINLSNSRNISGLTICGGEPFDWVPHMLNYYKYYVHKFYGIYNDYKNIPLFILNRYYSELSNDDIFEINPIFHLVRRYKDTYPYKTIWVYTKYPMNKLIIDKTDDKDIAIGSDICLYFIDVLVNGLYIKDNIDFEKSLRGDINTKYIDVKRSLQEGTEITYIQKEGE